MNLIDSLDGVLPTKRWGNFNFEKLKSLGGRVFLIIWGRSSPFGGLVITVTNGGQNSGQNNCHTMTFTFKE